MKNRLKLVPGRIWRQNNPINHAADGGHGLIAAVRVRQKIFEAGDHPTEERCHSWQWEGEDRCPSVRTVGGISGNALQKGCPLAFQGHQARINAWAVNARLKHLHQASNLAIDVSELGRVILNPLPGIAFCSVATFLEPFDKGGKLVRGNQTVLQPAHHPAFDLVLADGEPILTGPLNALLGTAIVIGTFKRVAPAANATDQQT